MHFGLLPRVWHQTLPNWPELRHEQLRHEQYLTQRSMCMACVGLPYTILYHTMRLCFGVKMVGRSSAIPITRRQQSVRWCARRASRVSPPRNASECIFCHGIKFYVEDGSGVMTCAACGETQNMSIRTQHNLLRRFLISCAPEVVNWLP